MNRIIEKIFKNKVVNFEKLCNFGFIKLDECYYHKMPMCNGQMQLEIMIDKQKNISTKVIDLNIKEEYTLFLIDSAVGSFVGQIREEYEKNLLYIANACCEKEVFQSSIAKEIIKYIKIRYSNELEYLWEKLPDYAVARRKDTKKWYAVMFKISKHKLGLEANDIVETIDLRMNPKDISKLLDNKKYLPGYHMNKAHWITLCLDESVPLKEILNYIDNSYQLAK